MPFLEHQASFELWFLRWVRRLAIPIVYTTHNVTKQDDPDQGRELYRRVYQTADALICHGDEARAELVRDFGVREEKIWVIPHGPLFEDRPNLSSREARLKLGLPSDEPLILFLGVISEYKGVLFLLDAWKQFRRLRGRGHLVIAGTGDARVLSEIQQKVSAEQLESVALWLHFIPVDQLPLLYQAADILVYPYKAGTTSGALLTGLKYGKAIVATKLPFFREHLEDGQTAILVDYGDKDALGSSLLDLASRPEERQRLASALFRQQSNSVSWDEIAKKTRECYESVLELSSGGDA
jgi:glycosyltransferase involved in cell wall biosynthesis